MAKWSRMFGVEEKLRPWPFERGYIWPGMRSVPYCMIANPGVSDVAEATKIVETWNGLRVKAFCHTHLRNLSSKVMSFCQRYFRAPSDKV